MRSIGSSRTPQPYPSPECQFRINEYMKTATISRIIAVFVSYFIFSISVA